MKPHGVLGPRLIRSENKGQKLIHLRSIWTERSYYLNFFNLANLYKNQILALNVHFYSSRKIYLTNSDGKVIIGSDNPAEF
jgi:hypothetical protein